MIRHALLAALCAAAFGCSAPTQNYFVRRGMDLADCFDVGTGVAGPIPYIRVKVTDYFVVGGGANTTIFALGWHGRYTGMGTVVEGGKGTPFVFNEEYAGAPPMVISKGPFSTTREYDPQFKPCHGTEIADKFWVGAWVAWLLNLRANFNPVEFADFLTGIFGWDLLADDGVKPFFWERRVREKLEPNLVL